MKIKNRIQKANTEQPRYRVLRWQISRIYRVLEKVPERSGTGHYMEITINPPTDRNRFLDVISRITPATGVVTKDLFREIEYDEIEYWLEDEKLGYIFEPDLLTLIKDPGRAGEEINRRSIEEDMVFMLIGPEKAINTFYKRISTSTIENLNELLSGKKLTRLEFQLVDITPQARKMASAIYNKALKNNTSGET
jgi:hypothetical protein